MDGGFQYPVGISQAIQVSFQRSLPQKTVEGQSSFHAPALYKGGYRKKSHNSSAFQLRHALGVVFSTALFRLVISAFAFLIKSPMVSFVGIAAPSDNANAFW